MKNFPLLFILLLTYSNLFSQTVPVLNSHCYGGTAGEERCFGAIDFPPGSLMTGKTNSTNGDVTGFHGGEDGWVVRTDINGNVVWAHAYGGSGNECLYTSIATSDGSIVSVGYSQVVSGDVTFNYGQRDFWVIKTDNLGNIIWENSYGGSSNDAAYGVVEMADGSIVVAGQSYSSDGQVTGHHGTNISCDLWIIRISPLNGNLIWGKSFGGNNNDCHDQGLGGFRPLGLVRSSDSTVAISCTTNSNDGDVQANPSAYFHFWLLEIGLSGSLLFENSFGGTGTDFAFNLTQTNDGGFLVIGDSGSNDGDVTGHHGSIYTPDYWIVKTDSSGVLQWQKSIGGTDYEDAFGVAVVPTGYYLIGRSASSDGDCSSAGYHGVSAAEFFVTLLDLNGNIRWKQDFGGTGVEEGYSIFQSSNGNIVCAGHTLSSDGDVLGQHGGFDFWMFEFADISSVEEQLLAENKLVVWPNPGNDFLNIELKENFQHDQLSIFSMQGSLVKTSTVENSSSKISVADLDPGVYELILVDEKGNRSHSSWVKY